VYKYGDLVRVRATDRKVMVKGVSIEGVTCSWYQTGEGWQEEVFPKDAIKYVRRGRPPRGVQPAAGKERSAAAGFG
jgi:uncharacterized protein YodC (DUF2158 family)